MTMPKIPPHFHAQLLGTSSLVVSISKIRFLLVDGKSSAHLCHVKSSSWYAGFLSLGYRGELWSLITLLGPLTITTMAEDTVIMGSQH